MSKQRHLKLVNATDDRFIERAVRVAFASSDSKTVDQHFGSAVAFVIIGLDREESRLLEVAQFGTQQQDGNEQKLISKLDALQGCVAVYSQAVGASAVMQLKARDVQPMKVSAGESIADIVTGLQQELNGEPSAWLALAIRRQGGPNPRRFEAMEAEGWFE